MNRQPAQSGLNEYPSKPARCAAWKAWEERRSIPAAVNLLANFVRRAAAAVAQASSRPERPECRNSNVEGKFKARAAKSGQPAKDIGRRRQCASLFDFWASSFPRNLKFDIP
jgi:hypothetical protein